MTTFKKLALAAMLSAGSSIALAGVVGAQDTMKKGMKKPDMMKAGEMKSDSMAKPGEMKPHDKKAGTMMKDDMKKDMSKSDGMMKK